MRADGPTSRQATCYRATRSLASRALRTCRERPRLRAAEQRDELAPLARISQERFYNLLAVGEGDRCLKWVDGVEKGLVIIGEP